MKPVEPVFARPHTGHVSLGHGPWPLAAIMACQLGAFADACHLKFPKKIGLSFVAWNRSMQISRFLKLFIFCDGPPKMNMTIPNCKEIRRDIIGLMEFDGDYYDHVWIIGV